MNPFRWLFGKSAPLGPMRWPDPLPLEGDFRDVADANCLRSHVLRWYVRLAQRTRLHSTARGRKRLLWLYAFIARQTDAQWWLDQRGVGFFTILRNCKLQRSRWYGWF